MIKDWTAPVTASSCYRLGGAATGRNGSTRRRLAHHARFSPNGFVVSAFQAALAAIRYTPIPEIEPCRHLQHALHAAVRIGDDTDTVAAIAGSLLGPRWGASAVPILWRAILHGKPGVYERPDYSSQDLVRLAVMSARHGEADSIGWPDADDLLPYYLREFPAPSEVCRLEEDAGVLLGNVFGATDTDADVTVSLCRMGRTQLDAVHHPITVELGLVDGGPTANSNLDFTLHDLAKAITRWRSENKTVLVHCVRAEHRTPAGGAAYVAETRSCRDEKRFNGCVLNSVLLRQTLLSRLRWSECGRAKPAARRSRNKAGLISIVANSFSR